VNEFKTLIFDHQYVTWIEETVVLITWSKHNWFDVQYNNAPEIYESVEIIVAPTVEDTVAALHLTQSQYLEPNSLAVRGPWRGYTGTAGTVDSGWDLNLMVSPRQGGAGCQYQTSC
jgi:hypothetical protein